MQKTVSAGTAGTTYRFPTISPEIFLDIPGGWGRSLHWKDGACACLPRIASSWRKRPSPLPPPHHSAQILLWALLLHVTYYPPKIKSLFCINSFIAGGMCLALMGTVASACLPHVCVCLFLRGPRGLPAALWAVDGQIASLPRDGHRDLWARACSTSSLRKNCWRWQEPWDKVWTQLFVEQGQPLPVSGSRWLMWSQHRHLQL